MQTKHIVMTRGIPKTGQSVSYEEDDDGLHQYGWWKGRKLADNKVRFISKSPNGNDIVIDNATGLVWPARANRGGCNNGDKLNFEEVVSFASALDFANFQDWRVPNVKEVFSLINFGRFAPALYTDFFTVFSIGKYWTSTTAHFLQAKAFYVDINTGWIYDEFKTNDCEVICVRGGT